MELENLLPMKPAMPPIDIRQISNLFAEYLCSPASPASDQNASGRWHCPAFLQGSGHELITDGAIMIGLLIRGDDVSALLPSLEDYFLSSEQVFLNGVGNTLTEYWYLMYVNALAMEIMKRGFWNDSAWRDRYRANANRLVSLANRIHYDFDAQGYDFTTTAPFTRKDEYRQPDAIAGYGYLMLHAYQLLGDPTYKQEALHALTLYQSFPVNPWYEIPSGAMACLAAAHLAGSYPEIDLHRMLEFAFDPDRGCLQTGRWGESEVNGLMCGWRGYTREEALSMAYSLESMVVLPFIAPIAKYAPQYATFIGRYALNLTANLRWFYAGFVPNEAQSRKELPSAVPYESIRRDYEGQALYACGDFHSHRSIYGGALSLWLGEIVMKTNDECILQLDLNKTDFLSSNEDSTYLFYNPHTHDTEIQFAVGDSPCRLFDVGSKSYVGHVSHGTAYLKLPTGAASVIRMEPVAGFEN